MKQLTWKRVVLVFLILLIVTFSAGVVIWMQATRAPSDIALTNLRSDDQVRVSQQSGMLLLEPLNGIRPTGFILYPGAGVDYRSYAPILRQIAQRGYIVAVPSMPLNLAFFKTNAADQIIEKYPEIDNWVIGGHSLGGVVAANYAAGHPSVEGVVFWAAYPGDNSLEDVDIKVLSVYGSLDGLATPQQIRDSRSLLPPDTMFIEIDGGNHSQFGSYGFQDGDNSATISPDEQWMQVVDATVNFLDEISK